jgi:hypothetical protein
LRNLKKLLSALLSASILITNVAQAFVPNIEALATAPTAVLGACMGIAPVAGCLPNVSVQESDGRSFLSSPTPAILRADDLFIRCGDAVFSGSKIHTRLLEMIVAGNLTVETLAGEFRSDSHSSDICASLSSIYGLVGNVKVDRPSTRSSFGEHRSPSSPAERGPSFLADPRLGAVPTMRFADQEAMSRKVRELAQLVGQEKFYLMVGGRAFEFSESNTQITTFLHIGCSQILR